MKVRTAVFTTSAPTLKACPDSTLPEFAFIGRSNVGKSSLLNMLTERRDLAKVSDAPGKTRLINFFLINGTMTFVDLPGYGFAKGSRTERAAFSRAVADYLERRPNLMRIFVLIDSRLSPQRIDLEFVNWLAEGGVPFVLVFTKIDKKPSLVQANVSQFKQRMRGEGIKVPAVFTTSATTRKGRLEILEYIEKVLAAPLPDVDAPPEDDSAKG